jgi:hypothetical protein
MFGREPLLPLDIAFTNAVWKNNFVPNSNYVQQVKKRLEWAFKQALATQDTQKDRNKKAYDKRAKASELKPGDKVLVRVRAQIGKCKVKDKWEKEVYHVHCRPIPDIPVYQVMVLDKPSTLKTLHRNHLYLLSTEDAEDDTPEEDIEEEDGETPVASRTRSQLPDSEHQVVARSKAMMVWMFGEDIVENVNQK